MKLLEIGKDMKIKHSISSPSKVWGIFFLKKICMGGGQTFWGKLMGGAVLHED